MKRSPRAVVAASILALACAPSLAVITSTLRGDVPGDPPLPTLVSPDAAVAVVGEDDWVFYGDLFQNNISQATGQRRYSAEELETFESALTAQQRWLARRGIPLVFAVMPSKWEIYPEKLPGTGADSSILDQVLAQAGDGSPLVDLRPALRESRDTADTYSKLNGHWTEYGGYVAWTELAATMAARSPELQTEPPPALTGVDTVDRGNEFAELAGLVRPNSWTVPVFGEPLPSVQRVGADGALSAPSESTETDMTEMPVQSYAPGATNPGRLLAMCDSTCRALSPYLQTSFATVAQVQHQILTPAQRPNVPALIEQYAPTAVLYVMTQRYFDFGLQDGAFWDAANAFDDATTLLAEAAPGALPAPVATAPETTAVLEAIDIGGAGAVASITVQSADEGTLTVRNSAGGEHTELPIVAGVNTLFVTLPAASGPGTVLVSSSPEAGKVTVQSAILKAIT